MKEKSSSQPSLSKKTRRVLPVSESSGPVSSIVLCLVKFQILLGIFLLSQSSLCTTNSVPYSDLKVYVGRSYISSIRIKDRENRV